MNLKPLFSNVVVERDESEAQTKGGIILPDNVKEKPGRGTIVSVGPGKALDNGEVRPMSVNTGDKVVFSSYTGTEIKIDEKTYLVMSEENILAIVKN